MLNPFITLNSSHLPAETSKPLPMIVDEEINKYSDICAQGLATSNAANAIIAPARWATREDVISKTIGGMYMDMQTYFRVLSCQNLKLLCMRMRWRHLLEFVRHLPPLQCIIQSIELLDSRMNSTSTVMPGMILYFAPRLLYSLAENI